MYPRLLKGCDSTEGICLEQRSGSARDFGGSVFDIVEVKVGVERIGRSRLPGPDIKTPRL